MAKRHSCLDLVPIFSDLDEDSLIKINGIISHREYKKGELIYSPLTPPALFILARGSIKEYQISISGKEQLLRVIQPGEVLGEATLFSKDPPDSYAEALTDISVCMVEKDKFTDLLLEYPSISIKLLAEYSKRLKEADSQTVSIATESVASRIASYLLDLSEVEESDEFTLPLPMKELATFLATSPETLSRRLKDLEDENIIKRDNKKIKIIDKDELLFLKD